MIINKYELNTLKQFIEIDDYKGFKRSYL